MAMSQYISLILKLSSCSLDMIQLTDLALYDPVDYPLTILQLRNCVVRQIALWKVCEKSLPSIDELFQWELAFSTLESLCQFLDTISDRTRSCARAILQIKSHFHSEGVHHMIVEKARLKSLARPSVVFLKINVWCSRRHDWVIRRGLRGIKDQCI